MSKISDFVFIDPIRSYAQLIFTLAKREVQSKNTNTFLGWAWGVIGPLIQIAMYTFVFAFVFNVRWAGDAHSATAASALKIFLGLTIFNVFAECIGQSTGLVTGKVNFVKKIVFPLEVLPYVTLLTALRNFSINFLLFIACYIVFIGVPHPTVVLIVPLLIPMLLFSLGLMWFISSLTVFLRDMRNIVPIALTIAMFMTPIFYPASMLEERYGWILDFNILGWIIEECRRVVFDGAVPSFSHLAIITLLSVVTSSFGYFWFIKTKKGFADVL